MKFYLKATGLTFKETPEESMWVRNGTDDCPKKPGGGGRINFISVNSARDELIVENTNKGFPRRLRYMLRFNPDPRVLDPIIINKGFANLSSEEMLIGAGLAALGVLGLYQAVRRKY